jgi:hypothetical protein
MMEQLAAFAAAAAARLARRVNRRSPQSDDAEKAAALTELGRCREQIERIDNSIISLLAERLAPENGQRAQANRGPADPRSDA